MSQPSISDQPVTVEQQAKGWKWLAEQIVIARHLLAALLQQSKNPYLDVEAESALEHQISKVERQLTRLMQLEVAILDSKKNAQNVNVDGNVGMSCWLNDMGLKKIPVDLLRQLPPSTTSIDLSGNEISEIPEGAFSGLGQLTKLDLSRNQLTTLRSSDCCGLVNLMKLDISSNLLENIESDALSGLMRLTEVKASKNGIQVFPTLPRSVVTAAFDHNAIRQIDACALDGLHCLTYLNLSHNQITVFRLPATGLNVLDSLNLTSNQITELDGYMLRLLPRLKFLTLTSNKLSEIRSDSMVSRSRALTHLYLADNAIERIESNALTGPASLAYLELRNNRLTHIDEGMFSNLGSLRKLDVSNNLIRSVGDFAFGGLVALNSVDLSGNQIAVISDTAFVHGVEGDRPPQLPQLDTIELHDNLLEHVPDTMQWPTGSGWVVADLRNNRFAPAETARLDAMNNWAVCDSLRLVLDNFSEHELRLQMWLDAPLTEALATFRYLPKAENFYNLLHTVNGTITSGHGFVDMVNQNHNRIRSAVMDRLEIVIGQMCADPALAIQCIELAESGLNAWGDRTMLALWQIELECRKHAILKTDPGRAQLLQLGVSLHRFEKLMHFAETLSARNSTNLAEAVEIQLLLLENLHDPLLGELGRKVGQPAQILYEGSVIVHAPYFLEAQQLMADAESRPEYPQVLAAYLQTHQFWTEHLALDTRHQAAIQKFEHDLAWIEEDYRSESLELMGRYDYDAAVPAYRVAQDALDAKRNNDLLIMRERYALHLTAPVRETLDRLDRTSRMSAPVPTAAPTGVQLDAGWQWLAGRISGIRNGLKTLRDSAGAEMVDMERRNHIEKQIGKVGKMLSKWSALEAKLITLHSARDVGRRGDLKLTLNGMRLTEFPVELMSLLPANMIEIDFSKNAIRHIPEGVFERFTKLETLDLSMNQITALGKGDLHGLVNLKALIIFDNRLRHIAPDALSGLASLNTIDARENELQVLPALPVSIECAMFDHNLIQNIGPESLRGLHCLRDLSLEHNDISAFSLPAGGLRLLEQLCLNSNQLPAIDFSLRRLPNLTLLDLSDNRIERIEPFPFGYPSNQLSLLRVLRLSNNRIAHIETDALRGLSLLSRLDLSGNCLTKLEFGTVSWLSAMNFLNLSFNQIELIGQGAFDGLHLLMALDLSNNQIEAISGNAFFQSESDDSNPGFSFLSKIELHHNRLESLPGDMQWPVPGESLSIDLRSNRLSPEVRAALLASSDVGQSGRRKFVV